MIQTSCSPMVGEGAYNGYCCSQCSLYSLHCVLGVLGALDGSSGIGVRSMNSIVDPVDDHDVVQITSTESAWPSVRSRQYPLWLRPVRPN